MPTRVLLYGSCVSRDMFEHLDDDYQLVEYVARQSLISTTSSPVELPEGPDLQSPFQRRMVTGDFASSIGNTLAERADDIDLLVLDLVDERLGVIHLPTRGYVTRSQELLDSGLLAHFPDASGMIPFGSRAHRALWRTAAASFIGTLRQTGLLERTLLIESTFASRTDSGTPANEWWNRPARHWNKLYAPYYQVFKDAGVLTHVIGSDAVADAAHQWGPSAYHYADSAYLAIAATIREFRGPSLESGEAE